jgi:hypothetical protein
MWNQQQCNSDKHNDALNRHKRWMTELKVLLEQWLTDGNSIVLMVGLNGDVWTSQVAKSMVQIGLKEIVSSKHHAPNTHQQGSWPIDGIFIREEICPWRVVMWNPPVTTCVCGWT